MSSLSNSITVLKLELTLGMEVVVLPVARRACGVLEVCGADIKVFAILVGALLSERRFRCDGFEASSLSCEGISSSSKKDEEKSF
jgi:hypothetical protein